MKWPHLPKHMRTRAPYIPALRSKSCTCALCVQVSTLRPIINVSRRDGAAERAGAGPAARCCGLARLARPLRLAKQISAELSGRQTRGAAEGEAEVGVG